MPAAEEPGVVASGFLAFAVHAVFFGLLVIGISWQKKPVAPPVVELWSDPPLLQPDRTPPPVPRRYRGETASQASRDQEGATAQSLPRQRPRRRRSTSRKFAHASRKNSRRSAGWRRPGSRKNWSASARRQDRLQEARRQKEEADQARKAEEEHKLAESRARQAEELAQKQRADEERKRIAATEAERQAAHCPGAAGAA